MKILLTGSSGFIGKRLLEKLVSIYGKEKICLVTFKAIASFDCIVYKNYRDLDIGSYDVSDVELVIHAGAFTPKNAIDANLIKQCNDNVYFTEQLLSLPFKKLKKIVNISTLDVYASAEITSESTAIDPISLYGASKYYCEKLVKAFAVKNKIQCQTLRVGHVYGPGEEAYKKIIPITIDNVINGKPVEIWGNGLELRSFIYIDDVIAAIVNSIDRVRCSDIVNIVSGNSISIRDLVSAIIKISDKNTDVIFKESVGAARSLIFDNSLLRSSLLQSETDFMTGLLTEYNYMVALREDNI